MIKLMRLYLGLSMVAAPICITRADSVIAGEGPGKGYAQVPQGAYSVVAEVRAKPGKEAELRAATLPLVALVRSDPMPSPVYIPHGRKIILSDDEHCLTRFPNVSNGSPMFQATEWNTDAT
jgi:hypothetical protein